MPWRAPGLLVVSNRASEDTQQAQWRRPAMRLRNRLVLCAFVDNADMSEREVARRAGLSHSNVNHLSTGRRASCTLSTALAIAEALECPVGALFITESSDEQRSFDRAGSNCTAWRM